MNVDRDSGSVNAYINNCAWTGEQPERPDQENGGGGEDEAPIPKPLSPPESGIDDSAEFCAVINENGDLTKTKDEWNDHDMDSQVQE